MARHFAQHLTNRELVRLDDKGNMVYPHGDTYTSPKFPEQVPVFMELFNKAYTPEKTTEVKSDLDVELELLNQKEEVISEPENKPSEVADEFENKPVEN